MTVAATEHNRRTPKLPLLVFAPCRPYNLRPCFAVSHFSSHLPLGRSYPRNRMRIGHSLGLTADRILMPPNRLGIAPNDECRSAKRRTPNAKPRTPTARLHPVARRFWLLPES